MEMMLERKAAISATVGERKAALQPSLPRLKGRAEKEEKER